jgi:hypothetical protein
VGQIRRPKSEIRKKSEGRKPNSGRLNREIGEIGEDTDIILQEVTEGSEGNPKVEDRIMNIRSLTAKHAKDAKIQMSFYRR